MALETPHSQYAAALKKWEKCRDVIEGQEAVYAQGVRYLPMLSGQTEPEYYAMQQRGSFYNAANRTLDGLSGMVFRKPPIFTLPTALEPMLEDADLAGQPLHAFAECLTEEVLAVSRAGVLVDFPQQPEQALTRAVASQMNLRPFLKLYRAENIISWRVGQVGQKTTLTQVRLKELVVEEVGEFENDEIEQIRVLDLFNGQYRVRVFRDGAQHGEERYPVMQGKSMREIPFVFCGPRDLSPDVSKPVLLDLINENLSHYRTTVDLEHGAHFTALPTPYLFGINDNEKPTGVGPTALWSSQSSEAKAGLLEFTGKGLETLEKRLAVKEQHMAALGARMLAEEKRQVETAETASIHRQGENSVLSSISQAISLGLSKALQICALWEGVNDSDVGVELNRDFAPARMTAQEMTALMATWQGGGISKQTLFTNFQKGEVIESDKTFDDEESEIGDEAPALGMAGRDDEQVE
jgi:hypothetical protein